MFGMSFACFPFGGLQHAHAPLQAQQARLRACMFSDCSTPGAAVGSTSVEDHNSCKGDQRQCTTTPELDYEGGTLPLRAAVAVACALDAGLSHSAPGAHQAPKSKYPLLGKKTKQWLGQQMDPVASACSQIQQQQQQQHAHVDVLSLQCNTVHHVLAFMGGCAGISGTGSILETVVGHSDQAAEAASAGSGAAAACQGMGSGASGIRFGGLGCLPLVEVPLIMPPRSTPSQASQPQRLSVYIPLMLGMLTHLLASHMPFPAMNRQLPTACLSLAQLTPCPRLAINCAVSEPCVAQSCPTWTAP